MNLKEDISRFYMKEDLEYTLSSGRKSTLYFDIKGMLLNSNFAPEIYTQFLKLIIQNLRDVRVDYGVVGMELGGAQMVQLMVAHGGFSGAIVRKTEKKYGLQKRIEGDLMDNVVIVDDVITSGNTVEEVRKILAPNHNILGTFCIIDRTEDGERYISLYKEKDFL